MRTDRLTAFLVLATLGCNGAAAVPGAATPAATATSTAPAATAPAATAPAAPSAPAFDLKTTTILNSPVDIASWKESAKITTLDLDATGVFIDFTKRDGAGSWPDWVPPGWAGPITYTLWICLEINGQWYASGCIEYWRGLDRNGGPPSGYAANWYYDAARWGAMTGHQPAKGEKVGFFVSAGGARNDKGTPLKERSNVVIVPFPDDTGARWTY